MKNLKRLLLAITVFAVMMLPILSFAATGDGEKPGDSGSTQQEDTKSPTNDTKKNDTKSSSNYKSKSYSKYGTVDKDTIAIAFTGDMHSHVESDSVTVDGKAATIGGFASLTTALRKNFSYNYDRDAFLLDGGDFSMGTGYQTVFEKEAAELRLMGFMKYDVTTIGNHEFDYKTAGLTNMLNTAISKSKSDRTDLPQIVIANIDWDKTLADPDKKDAATDLKNAFDKYGVKDYTVIEKNGAKIAVFGIFGKQSDEYAPESGLFFKDPVSTAKDVVAEIKKNEKVDLIVCVSHSGISEKKSESEDEILANKVGDIDFILSAHSHTALSKPIVVNDTVIGACGSYTYNLGKVVYKKNKDTGKYEYDSYNLLPVNQDDYYEDGLIKSKVSKFKSLVNKEYFSKFGFSMEKVVTKNSYAFTPIQNFASKQGEDTLGNLISDSYVAAVKNIEGSDYKTVDVAVVPAGVIRASIPQGKVTAGQAFNVLSLGSGADGTPGYPLCSIYLKGKEIKDMVEVDATVSGMMPETTLFMSGISYNINPNRLMLNKSTDAVLIREDGSKEKIKNNETYRVVGDLYSLQMLGYVKDKTHKMLSIEPKDKEGNVLEGYDGQIIHNGDTELKAWYALASYMDSFSGSKVPEKYSKVEGRKNIVDSKNIIDLIKQPHRIEKLIIAGIVVALLIIAAIIFVIVYIVKGRRFGGTSERSIRSKRRKEHREKTRFVPEENMSERQKKAILNSPSRSKNLFSKRRHTKPSRRRGKRHRY